MTCQASRSLDDDRRVFERCTAVSGQLADGGRYSGNLRHFPFRDLDLSGDDGLVRPVHSWSAATDQLCGSECCEYHKLKSTQTRRTVNHKEPPNRRSGKTTSITTIATAIATKRSLRRPATSCRWPRARQAVPPSSNARSTFPRSPSMASRAKHQALRVVETSRLACEPSPSGLGEGEGLTAQESRDLKYTAVQEMGAKSRHRGPSRRFWGARSISRIGYSLTVCR